MTGGDGGVKEKYSILLRAGIVLLLFGVCVWLGWQESMVLHANEINLPSILLDAGHGGEDGGAVSVSGEKESQINLDIAKKLDWILSFCGEAPMMLRNEDVSLHDSTAQTIREKKVSDLKHRVELVNQQTSATLVSIHQNSYPEPKYKGTQVFYAPTGGSKQLAEEIQKAVLENLQHDNKRTVKQIPESVYLMNHISNTAVLIECGFLTNPEEEQLLKRTDYQCKLSLVLATALIDHVK